MLNPEFFDAVSFNCDVSDSKYWGYFSICTLLLRLRQLFKIERDLEPWESINNDEILPWIEKKEEKWKELENAQLIQLKINGKSYQPFDIEGINDNIIKNGFIYGAGYALFMKPSFFVGLIHKYEKIDGYEVFFVDKEIIRDLFSSSGMSIGNTIYIRLTDIKYRLWEDLHGWINKKKSFYGRTLSKFGHPANWEYPFKEFRSLVYIYSKIVLHHEIAELQENIPQWNEIIKKCDNSKTEYILRGIKDFIADFSEKGPLYKAIIEKDKELLSLYILTQGVYQKKILNQVILQIEKALLSEDWGKIEEIRKIEYERWKNNHDKILEIYKIRGFDAVKNITNRIFEGGTN